MKNTTSKRPKWVNTKVPNLENKILLFSRGKENPLLSERDYLIWAISLTTPHWVEFIDRGFVEREKYERLLKRFNKLT